MENIRAIHISESDNVAVAVRPIPKGTEVWEGTVALEDIPQGHKVALSEIPKGQDIIKYGYSIGHAETAIAKGAWVHTHNMKTNLKGEVEYVYRPEVKDLEPMAPATFQGYLRPDGRAGVRNEIWIIPTVGCVNDVHCDLPRRDNPFRREAWTVSTPLPIPLVAARRGPTTPRRESCWRRWPGTPMRELCWW